MSTQVSLENFEQIYESTYQRTLKYILCRCHKMEDVNDLIQDTYVEFYHILNKKKYLQLENTTNFVIGIAKKKLQRYYGFFYQIKNLSVKEDEMEIPSDQNIEEDMIKKLNAEEVWKYIKKKNIRVIQIFYLYYCFELKIAEIAKELQISESNVKNLLYRTIKEIRENIQIEGDRNDE